jgi:rubredoxin
MADEQLTCPECGAGIDDLEYRKTSLTTHQIAFAVIASDTVRVVPVDGACSTSESFHCVNCHHEWQPEQEVRFV